MPLRALVKFIEKSRRVPVYTNFKDELRAAEHVALPGISTGVDAERFREKALAFLRDKLEEPALHKVRWNEPLTAADLESLEQMLVEAGVGTAEQVKIVARQEHGLGLFLRSLVGLDRVAAKSGAFSRFIEEQQLNASQLDFVNLIIDHLTQCGWMWPEKLLLLALHRRVFCRSECRLPGYQGDPDHSLHIGCHSGKCGWRLLMGFLALEGVNCG